MFNKSEKIGLFIDGANFYATTKELRFMPDYKVMLDWFSRTKGDVRKAAYYTGIIEGQRDDKLIPLLTFLQYNGWDLVTKPAKVWVNAVTGEKKIKGNVDIELTLDIIDATEYLDHIYLFSGDGDFSALVKWVQNKGVKVTVVSSIETRPPMCADELRRQANCFLDVCEIRQFFKRQPANLAE